MLVGRDSECGVLDDLLATLRQGSGAALVLRGDPGIGKTTLLRDLVRRAGDIRVLAARGMESEVELPFAGLHELLRPVLESRSVLPAVQREALEGALALGSSAGAAPFAIQAATLGLLEVVATSAGLLVVVDDAQWLDAASREALLFSARRVGPVPLGIVLAARSGRASPLEGADIPELVVGGLGDEDALRVLEAGARYPVAAEVRDQLVRASAGNPLALIELCELLSAEQLAGTAALPDPLPVGARIEEAFAARARTLSIEAGRALLIAAASDSADLELIVRAAEGAGISSEALEEAEAAGLIELSSSSTEFRHPLLRSAVYQAASRAERRRAHQAIAAALEDDPTAASRAAWHLAVGALRPDARLAQRLEEGGAEARRRSAYTAAAVAFERAAALSPQRSAAARRLLAAAEARQLAGESPQAIALLERALEQADDDAHLRADVLALRGRIDTWRGPAVMAFHMLSEDAVQVADPGQAALALANAVTSAIVVGEFPRALDAARAARELGERAGGIAEVVTAVQLGKILILVGEAREGHPMILRCDELLAEGWSETRALDLVHCAPALQSVEEYALADRILRSTVATARERGALGLLPYSLGALSELEVRVGRWADALAHGAEAVQAASSAAQQGQLSYNLARLARLEAAKGLADACLEHAGRAVEIAHQHSFRTTLIWAEWARGHLELAHGRPDVAATHLARAQRTNDDMGCKEPGRSECSFDLIEALVRGARTEEAVAALERLEDQAAHTGRVLALAASARYRGMLSASGWEDQFRRALTLHDRTEVPFERARTQFCFGERLRRERRRVDAREQLRQALQTFEQLGAAPWAARAREELAATGERARVRGDVTVSDELTPHELRVAALVAEGATNREAALALFLSPKTVEAHLRNIYRKLGIRSRSELAALAARGGLPEPPGPETVDTRSARANR